MNYELPSGFTALEYVEATGLQHLNTGITGGATWHFDIQFGASDGVNRQLMGYGGSSTEYWGVHINNRYGLAD